MTFRITPRPKAPAGKPASLPLVEWTPTKGAPSNHVVVIGSPKGGSGKTSSTLFCATTLAQMGARVLLIEATEGQAPLTQAFNSASQGSKTRHETGLGIHLYRALGSVHPSSNFEDARSRFAASCAQEAHTALDSLRPVFVTPDLGKSLDFLPAGKQALAAVQSQATMQLRPIRRALLQAFLDSLIAAHPKGGWDFIFIDTLPTAESTITQAALGVADSYALVVDMESAHPLVGFSHIRAELVEARKARVEEGKGGEAFKGLVLNRVASSGEPTFVEKVNRAVIAAQQKQAEDAGLFVPILREIPRMMTLTLLGFNYLAVQALKRHYGGKLPSNLDDLSDEDVAVILDFVDGVDQDGTDFQAAAGVAWLQEANPGHRDRLAREADSLAPLILSFGAGSALREYLDACPEEAS